MAYLGSSLFGRINLYKNVIKKVDNTQKLILYNPLKNNGVSRFFTSEVETVVKLLDNAPPTSKKKLSKAMKAYLQRAKDYDEFIKKEISNYQIGKRHLANMMGENPDTFTQNDIDNAIKYLFPSGLYDKRAHPIMAEPHTIFPPKKDAEFDIEGRPFHSLFYTTKPNYYQALYEIVEKLEELNRFEDEQLNAGLLPDPTHKANLLASRWMTFEELKAFFMEELKEKDYDAFVVGADKLADHPYSANAYDVLMKFRKERKKQTQGLVIPPLEYDENGRPFIFVPNLVKNSTRGTLKLLGNGTGKININGYGINYFDNIQHREQAI